MNIKETVSRVMGIGGEGDEQAPNALDLMRSDHREVDALFAVALGEETPAAQRRETIAKIVQALTIHAEMEEALFYPALREAGGKDERDSVLEANEEHGVVKDLIAKIEQVGPRDETIEAKVTVLKELVHHHVKEEEGTIFGEAREALGDERLQQLGEEMQRFKERAQRGGGGGRSGGSRKKSSGKKSSAKGGSAKKSSAKRSSGKKSSGKNSSGKKSSERKSSSKKSSGRKSAGKKRR